MANTYSNLFYHIVFSTKGRVAYIHPEVQERLWAYIGGTAREHDLSAVEVGGIEDHAHALVMARPVITPCDIPRILKGASSKWIHETFPKLQNFAWQDGYGLFSVSRSQVSDVQQYIRNQTEHHRRRTFEDEYRSLLRLHEIDYDEKYLLG